MSMVLVARMVPPDLADRLVDDPALVEELLFEDEEQGPDVLDLDKAWHGVHWLLTGTAWDATTPAGQAVLGGREIGEDLGYGPARLLSPADVTLVALTLGQVTVEQLSARDDPAAMEAADIYPAVWSREPQAVAEWLVPSFEELRDFYQRAAARDLAVVVALT